MSRFEFVMSTERKATLKQTIATRYPAHVQPNGTYMFRPAFKGKTPPDMWGWTASLDQAHPDYFAEGEVPMGCQRVEIEGKQVLVYCSGNNELSSEEKDAIAEYSRLLAGGEPKPRPEEPPPLLTEGHQDGCPGSPTPDPEFCPCNEPSGRDDPESISNLMAAGPPIQREEPPVIELTKAGSDTGRYTEHMHYPLPPALDRAEVKFDGWKRYKLPHPVTGKLTGFTRSTTLSGTTADDYNLMLWKQRTKVLAVLIASAAYDLVSEESQASDYDAKDLVVSMFGRTFTGADVEKLAELYHEMLDAFENGTAQAPNKKIDEIDFFCGGAEAREHGQAVHEWLGALDTGQVLLWQIPDAYQVHARAYQDCLQRAGLIAVPAYVERIVYNDRGEETICGTIDRVYYCVVDGCFYLGDLKTSKTLEFSSLEYGIQFAIYGYARFMLLLDGTGWQDFIKLPGIPHPDDHELGCTDRDTAIWAGETCETCGAAGDERTPQAFCVHVPSDQPERSQVVPFFLQPGAEYAGTAMKVRAERKDADKRIRGGNYPIPTAEALRYVEARQAVQNIHDADEAMAVMEQYEDVWDDDLTAFGATCFEAISTFTYTEE